MAKYYPTGLRPLHMLGKVKPLKKNRKSNFEQLSASVKYKCKELEMFRILNYELKYELNQTY